MLTMFRKELSKPKELQRDEWMLVPPSSSDLLGSECILGLKEPRSQHHPRT